MWFWGIAALAALLWPDRISGPLHGIPLDGLTDVVVIAVIAPLLLAIHTRFLDTKLAKALVVALLAWKLFSALALVQDGWCVRVLPSKPYARDAGALPHSWDVRADWRAAEPACAAVMTHAYHGLLEFPVWFFNLPPPNDNLPAPDDRPPGARLRMTVQGFLYAPRDGILDVAAADDVNAELYVDGAALGRAAITRGLHTVVIDASMTGDRWALVPRLNGRDLWPSSFTPTVRRPSSIDLAVRPWGAWLTTLLAGSLICAWLAAAAKWLATTWRAAPRRLQGLRGALVLFGVPWLALVVWHSAPLAGRWTLYSAGDDFWQFQRYAYRIVMLGYWLEGGSATFWFQPLYRWIAGVLHLVFGDSSIGESVWDGACVLVGALAAFRLTRVYAGYRWALAAAVLSLVVFRFSAAYTWMGAGLGELSSSGLLYLAICLMAGRRNRMRVALAAGLLATLAFYARLNNAVMVASVAAFALSLHVPASAALWPSRWLARLRWQSALCVLGTLVVGVLLFAWRTWHYTGVFSVFYGTQREMLSTVQPGLTWTAIIRRMIDSVMMVVTIHDPARFDPIALPVIGGVAAAVLAAVGVPRFRTLPLATVLCGLASIAGALVARGDAYAGRFSVHAIPIGCALTACAAAALTETSRAVRRAPIEMTAPASTRSDET